MKKQKDAPDLELRYPIDADWKYANFTAMADPLRHVLRHADCLHLVIRIQDCAVTFCTEDVSQNRLPTIFPA
ncbi:hypothetical protein BST61_g1885 [Cercospora zeina]